MNVLSDEQEAAAARKREEAYSEGLAAPFTEVWFPSGGPPAPSDHRDA